MTNRTNVFAASEHTVWTHRYACELVVAKLTGGIPNDPKVAEGWLRAKLIDPVATIEAVLAETMAGRGVSRAEAVEDYVTTANVNGFICHDGVMVMEGRQVKAAIKEAFNVANAGGHFPGKTAKGAASKTSTWGVTGKGLMSFVAEHVMVPDRYVPILDEDGQPRTSPTATEQRFVHTHRGSAIQYEDYVDPAILRFEVWSDWDFDQQWPTVWNIGGQQGIGATRSQGCGTYFVSRWDRL